MSVLRILAAGLSIILVAACSDGEMTGRKKVKIQVGERNDSLSLSSLYGLPDSQFDGFRMMAQPIPTNFAQLNCYALFVNYPEAPAVNECWDPTGAGPVSWPHEVGGLADLNGGSVELDVLIGGNRIFEVIGFGSNVACPNLETSDHSIMDQEVSYIGYKVASLATEVAEGTANLSIHAVSAPLASFTQIGECFGPKFGGYGHDGGNCGTVPTATDMMTTADGVDFAKCFGPKASNDYYYLGDMAAGGEIFVGVSSAGIPYTFQVGATTSTIQLVIDANKIRRFDDDGTIALNSGAITLNNSTAICIDIDTASDISTNNPTIPCDADDDIKIYATGSALAVSAPSGNERLQQVLPGVTQEDPNEIVMMKVYNGSPPTHSYTKEWNNQTITDGSPGTFCYDFKIGSINLKGEYSLVSAATAVDLAAYSSGASAIQFYDQSNCGGSVVTQGTIPLGEALSSATYSFKQISTLGADDFFFTLKRVSGDTLVGATVNIQYDY